VTVFTFNMSEKIEAMQAVRDDEVLEVCLCHARRWTQVHHHIGEPVSLTHAASHTEEH
jgi:hypothetical protein